MTNEYTRSSKKDRSANRYTEEEFLTLPRSQQLELANIWWMDSKGFDEGGMFQFSYTHFAEICKKLGFKKGVIDTGQYAKSGTSKAVKQEDILWIERGRRVDTVEKKMTLTVDTFKKYDELIGSQNLTNIEKSKIFEAIINAALDECLKKKERGDFIVGYRATKAEQLL